MNDGGPAFPMPQGGKGIGYDSGMSLRDWFAGQALVGILSAHGSHQAAMEIAQSRGILPHEVVANIAYLHADALIAERAK